MVYILGIMLFVHAIDLWVSIGFLLTYIVYVALVFVQSKHIGGGEAAEG